MSLSYRHFFLSWALCLILPALQASASEPWIEAVTPTATPENAGQAHAFVLLDEISNEIDATGNNTMTHRYVVRVLSNKGAETTLYSLPYDAKAAKIRSLKAWLLRPGGKTITRNNGSWADLCFEDSNTLLTDTRQRVISFTDQAVAGDVFAVEVKVSTPLLCASLRAKFGGTLPTATERFKVSVPPGFKLTPRLKGTRLPSQSQSEDGTTWTWTSLNKPYRPAESYMASGAQIESDLILSLEPPATATQFKPVRLPTWNASAAWLESLNAGQCDSSPALIAKAHELVGQETELIAKIRAIGAYTQKIRYIAHNEGLNKGLGYVARKASVVFANGFGDCKDKTNLMRAMLRELGITSHTLVVATLDQGQVREDVPGTEQFNHAICAVEVDETVQAPAVLVSEKQGRLLLFDPTDAFTSLGNLPSYLQGALGLIVDPATQRLSTLPVIAPETGFKIHRVAELKLQSDGTLRVDCHIEAFGQVASHLRADRVRAKSPEDLNARALDILGETMKGASLLSRSEEDLPAQGRYKLHVVARTKSPLQATPARLLIAKLDVLGQGYVPRFPEMERRLPIELPSLLQDDETSFEVPAGLSIVELPQASFFEDEYGSIKLEVTQVANRVTLHRTLLLKRTLIPAADYAKLKNFLSKLARANRSALLLKETTPPKAAQ